MSQHIDRDEEWDVDEQTYILYEHTTTERTEEYGVDHANDETYERTAVDDVSTHTAYFQVAYLECESEGAPAHDPEFYLQEIIEQNGQIYDEYDLHPERTSFSVSVFNDEDDELVVVHFKQYN